MSAIINPSEFVLAPSGSARSVQAARDALSGQRRGLKALLPFIGPAVVASVGYLDPGNFATNIQAGASYHYQLLWVVALANLLAMLFQAMAAKLGIVTGCNLAELCRQQFSKPVVIGMWIGSELAAMATDLAEFLGGGLGISLMLHLSLPVSLGLTALATFGILALQKRGFRSLELFITALVGMIGVSYILQLIVLPPAWHAVLYHSVVPQLPDRAAQMLAVGIIGATIMPHTLYLHSGLTQGRTPTCGDGEKRRLLKFSNREVVLALGFAGVINMAMLVMSADIFPSKQVGADIGMTHHALLTGLGAGTAALFLVALIASGISSSAVGTMAGQIVMQGFVGFQVPMWLRRVVTMAPALIAAAWLNPMTAIVASQAVLSMVLPLPLVALIVLSSRRKVMGAFTPRPALLVGAGIATAAIVALNIMLIVDMLP